MNNNSTANGPEQKPSHMHYQYGRNDMPNPQRPQKSSLLSKIRGKFQEKPATPEEVRQLKLQAQKETYKTAIYKAKSARPGRLERISGGFGGGERQPSYRRSSPRGQEDSFLLGPSKSSGGSFLDFGSGPSLSMFGGGQQKGRGKQQKSGLEELF